MTRRQILEDLRDRLKMATGPNPKLDEAIGELIILPGASEFVREALSHPSPYPRFANYTGSLDAAVNLAADGDWGVSWAVESVFSKGFPGDCAVIAYVWRDHPTNEASFCQSPCCVDFKEAAKHLPRLICLGRIEYELSQLPEDET
jgi:hypothetical protein